MLCAIALRISAVPGLVMMLSLLALAGKLLLPKKIGLFVQEVCCACGPFWLVSNSAAAGTSASADDASGPGIIGGTGGEDDEFFKFRLAIVVVWCYQATLGIVCEALFAVAVAVAVAVAAAAAAPKMLLIDQRHCIIDRHELFGGRPCLSFLALLWPFLWLIMFF